MNNMQMVNKRGLTANRLAFKSTREACQLHFPTFTQTDTFSREVCVINRLIVARSYIDAGAFCTGSTLNENSHKQTRCHATNTRACHWL